MVDKLTYEDLEQRVKELEKDAIGRKRPEEALRFERDNLRNIFESI